MVGTRVNRVLPGEEALIVSSAKESGHQARLALLTEALNSAYIGRITVLDSAGETRRVLLEKNFDFVIIDAPLRDESGENLAMHIADKNLTQVIIAVNSEHHGEVSAVCQKEGILVISKPLSREVLWISLSLAKSMNIKLKRVYAENEKLKQKIEDIRTIDRAKYLLISYLGLTEQESHRFIEKQAMDLRSTKRAIADGIIKTYGN